MPEAPIEELIEFFKYKLQEYNYYNDVNKNLWDFFRIDFKSFTVALFESVSTVERRSTRDFIKLLRRRKVYIEPITKEKTIEQALYNCVEKEERYKWTFEEI